MPSRLAIGSRDWTFNRWAPYSAARTSARRRRRSGAPPGVLASSRAALGGLHHRVDVLLGHAQLAERRRPGTAPPARATSPPIALRSFSIARARAHGHERDGVRQHHRVGLGVRRAGDAHERLADRRGGSRSRSCPSPRSRAARPAPGRRGAARADRPGRSRTAPPPAARPSRRPGWRAARRATRSRAPARSSPTRPGRASAATPSAPGRRSRATGGPACHSSTPAGHPVDARDRRARERRRDGRDRQAVGAADRLGRSRSPGRRRARRSAGRRPRRGPRPPPSATPPRGTCRTTAARLGERAAPAPSGPLGRQQRVAVEAALAEQPRARRRARPARSGSAARESTQVKSALELRASVCCSASREVVLGLGHRRVRERVRDRAQVRPAGRLEDVGRHALAGGDAARRARGSPTPRRARRARR